MDHWVISLRAKTETKQLNFGLAINQPSPQRVIADAIGDSSLISPYFFDYFLISKKMK